MLALNWHELKKIPAESSELAIPAPNQVMLRVLRATDL